MDLTACKALSDLVKTFSGFVTDFEKDKQLSYDRVADAADQLADIWDGVLEYPDSPGYFRVLKRTLSQLSAKDISEFRFELEGVCFKFMRLWREVLKGKRLLMINFQSSKSKVLPDFE
jgi:hypothetical protein